MKKWRNCDEEETLFVEQIVGVLELVGVLKHGVRVAFYQHAHPAKPEAAAGHARVPHWAKPCLLRVDLTGTTSSPFPTYRESQR